MVIPVLILCFILVKGMGNLFEAMSELFVEVQKQGKNGVENPPRYPPPE